MIARKQARGDKFLHWYFDSVYTPAYDFTTGRFSRYHKLQEHCINRLNLGRTTNLLCVGVGTGNEITRVLNKYPDTVITAIDYSQKALNKTAKKVKTDRKKIDFRLMDAEHLNFKDKVFDRVLCIHVMDFLPEPSSAASEIVRVIKEGGDFVITFPSDNEGPGMGTAFFKESVNEDKALGKSVFAAYIHASVNLLMGLVYLPIYFRKGKKVYSKSQLETMFAAFGDFTHFDIEEEPVYRDFIVHGVKIR